VLLPVTAMPGHAFKGGCGGPVEPITTVLSAAARIGTSKDTINMCLGRKETVKCPTPPASARRHDAGCARPSCTAARHYLQETRWTRCVLNALLRAPSSLVSYSSALKPLAWLRRIGTMTDLQRSIAGYGKTGNLTRDMCRMHYSRWQRHGDPLVLLRPTTRRDPVCSVPGCGEPHVGWGYCNMHHTRCKRHGQGHGKVLI
jgi:hypothetical protein